MDPRILGGVFLGWALGSNDSANVFGTAVSSFMLRYRTAVILMAVFVLIGALLGGMPGIRTYGSLTSQSVTTAFYISMAAAITVTLMTIVQLPVSTSQAVVGGIVGIGLLQGKLELQSLTKVVLCWIGTPTGAALIAVILYFTLSKLFSKFHLHFLTYDRLMRTLLILAGAYGAYALGANNVANVTGVFFQAKTITAFQALLIGGLSIGLGAITYSKKVMITVGRRIIPLDAFSAFVAVLAEAITVHIYSIVGVPVSTSQAVVGAVVGIGLLKGMRMISKMTVIKITIGWFLTPALGGGLSFAFGHFFGL
ncbi:MAG: inorganic phosphate transporter [Caldiserica bacterium]|nr:inorganic phosphate transporter [Caldisericota bacterium]